MKNDPCIACGYSPTRPVGRPYEFTLVASYPSQNQIGSNGKGREGMKYRKHKGRLRKALEAALRESPVPDSGLPRRVTIVRHYGKRKRPYDRANLVGGGKPLVDLLKECGILVNDSLSWFEGIYRQIPSEDGIDRIEVTVQDFLDDNEYYKEPCGQGHLLMQFPHSPPLAFDSRYDNEPREVQYQESHDRVLLASKDLTARQARIELASKAMKMGLIRVGEVFETGRNWCLRVRYPTRGIQ